MNIIGGALLLSVCGVLLRNFGWKGAPVFSAVALLLLLSELTSGLGEVSSFIGTLFRGSRVGDVASAALKILGAGYLFGICADVCRELGEGGVAKAIEVVGRVEIIIIVLPFLSEIINLGADFL